MKVNLYLWKWKWQNIDTQEAKQIVNDYSSLIDHVLTAKSAWENYKNVLFDIEDIEKSRIISTQYNDKNGKRFISITRAEEA